MKFLVVLSAACAIATGAPQLVYGGYGLGLGAVHAVPTVAKQTVKYKTAAFEPVEADTLVPGPVNYVHTPAVYGYGLHGAIAPAIAAAAEPVELPAIELPTTYAAHGLLGYPAALGYHGLGLPVVAAPA